MEKKTDGQKTKPEKPAEDPVLGKVIAEGEGYITRKDTGERIPFHFQGEGRL